MNMNCSLSTLRLSSNHLSFVFLILFSCAESNKGGNLGENHTLSNETNFLLDYAARTSEGLLNVVVEIPAGTVDKWEVEKSSGEMIWTFENDKPRVVNYLGYPGNYGMIPRTLLSKSNGGDGDPLMLLF